MSDFPHVHTITLFDVEKIVIERDPVSGAHLRFIGPSPDRHPSAVTIHAWKGSGDGAPEIVLLEPEKEPENALERQPETD